ncbi:hypothetical protein, partial [Clostridium sp.]|uniref:hypothetical protein n=1 Tax=Clostridium sp. TaxID=1506 RepID=UPI002627BA4E
HTGTVLYNLLNILKDESLGDDLKHDLENAINKGANYYINAFFNLKSGKAKTLIGYRRPAGPVQYAEAILAFCEYITTEKFDGTDLKLKIRLLLPKAVNQLISLINFKNGSVPSDKVICWMNIDSIRWGNGPALQAIMSYLSIYDDVYGEKL